MAKGAKSKQEVAEAILKCFGDKAFLYNDGKEVRVNTTDSAVRLTHIPTGIVVYSQTERSQIRNKEKAIKILKSRVYDLKLREQEEKEAKERKVKIGTGDRSEKIRTYNYPQNRITDHRIGYTSMNLDRVMDGDMEDLIEALINEDQRKKLEENV